MQYGQHGHFRWNPGGWFGTLLGGTLWIGLLGASVVPISAVHGIGILVLFAAVVGLGVWLWRRRGGLTPYRGFQALLAGMGTAAVLSAAVVTVTPDRARVEELLGGPVQVLFFLVLMYPLMMGVMALLELRAKRKAD